MSADADTWYFAYGSNMDRCRLEERLEQHNARILGCASGMLIGYRLAFDKLGKDGTGRGNIRVDANGCVEGVLWRVTSNGLDALDRFESVKQGHYQRAEVEVALGGTAQRVRATTYVAIEGRTDPVLKPSVSYLGHFLAGAPFLSPDYVAMLRRVECAT